MICVCLGGRVPVDGWVLARRREGGGGHHGRPIVVVVVVDAALATDGHVVLVRLLG